jgi:acyl-CoA dehydrogenase
VRELGQGGWLRHAVGDRLDTRSICLARETLAYHDGLADFAFAMQGLGSGAISLQGTEAQKERYLPRVARGEAIAAFALSEPDAGSDVASLQCAARVEGDQAVLDGEKTWISNGGIADFYVVFCRSGEGAGRPRHLGLHRRRGTPGFEIAERIEVIAPHPLARLRFRDCRVPLSQRIGAPGRGLQGGDAHAGRVPHLGGRRRLGFARRRWTRRCTAPPPARCSTRAGDFQLTQARLAQMATTIDSAALLVYRAAWLRDQGQGVTKEAAMAKMAATEGAQQVIDAGRADVRRPGRHLRPSGRAAVP